jgi:hypothetical protein
MNLSKAILAVLISVAVLPTVVQAKSKPVETHIIASTGHPRNPFMWLFGHRIDHAPKHRA